MAETGKVVIEVDSKSLLEAPDGPAYLRDAALREIELTRRYDRGEMELVRSDPSHTLEESCRRQYLRVRQAASSREMKEARVQDRGKPVTHRPYRWRVAIHYERPATRNWRDRVRRE